MYILCLTYSRSIFINLKFLCIEIRGNVIETPFENIVIHIVIRLKIAIVIQSYTRFTALAV